MFLLHVFYTLESLSHKKIKKASGVIIVQRLLETP